MLATQRAVKIRPDRDDDFQITGKRHDFVVDYEVGYSDEGKIRAVKATFAARAGFSADLSGPVTDPDILRIVTENKNDLNAACSKLIALTSSFASPAMSYPFIKRATWAAVENASPCRS